MIRYSHGFEFFNRNYFQVAGIQVGRVAVYQAGHLGAFGKNGPFGFGPCAMNKCRHRTGEQAVAGK